MRLPFAILTEAHEHGPEEVKRSEIEHQMQVKRDSHAGSKDEEYMQHQDTKLEGHLANMRIEEVEQEHE